jgi:tRNA(fMet)-specific endonuclease VapC
MIYLLDSNIINNLARDPKGLASQRVSMLGKVRIVTSIIVCCEIEFGLVKKGSGKLRAQVETVLNSIELINFETPVHKKYGALRDHLRQIGKPIGPNDLLIAAHALCLGATLVTNNEREFARVPGLKVENWLRES